MRHLIVILLLAACSPAIPTETGPEPAVLFCPRDNCSEHLISLVDTAESVDCAFFDLDLPELISLLERKHARIVIDNTNEREIRDTKLNYRPDTSSQLSHNKFCVLDNRIVWTGSLNPTHNGDRRNNNNALIIRSRYLAENYATEFDELWNGQFGTGPPTPYPTVRINGNLVHNWFCPEDGCRDRVLAELLEARQSIYFMTFSFTDRTIADALISKSLQGVHVRGLMEKQRVSMRYNLFSYLNASGIGVWTDHNPKFMHHKVFIIDNTTVITGSWNPTKSGSERNDENIMIISSERIARQFLDEFSSLSRT
jgi:phosphatidylserine/phosphatidylglycerophosphate/cardiolipin synthase-like enzyme